MDELVIEQTYNSPYIHFNGQTGLLKIQGKSIHEDPASFYYQLLEWLDQYFANQPAEVTTLEFTLDYANSAACKYLRKIMNILQTKSEEGYNCVVKWYYEKEDESIADLGEFFRLDFNLPFHLIPID